VFEVESKGINPIIEVYIDDFFFMLLSLFHY